LRIITFSNFRENAKPLLKKFQILNVENMCKLELGKLMYLYENGQMLQHLIKLFTKTSNIHEYSYNTRQVINSGLFISAIKLELGKKTIKHRGSNLRNRLNSVSHLFKEKQSMHLLKKDIMQF